MCYYILTDWPDTEFYLIHEGLVNSGVLWFDGEEEPGRVWGFVCLSLSVCPVKIGKIGRNWPLSWIPQSVWPQCWQGQLPGWWVGAYPPFLQHYCMTVWQSDCDIIWLSNCLDSNHILHLALSIWATAPCWEVTYKLIYLLCYFILRLDYTIHAGMIIPFHSFNTHGIWVQKFLTINFKGNLRFGFI